MTPNSRPQRPKRARRTDRAPTSELVSRAELARRKGVNRSSVTRACEPGGPLADAVVGSKVDASHPDAIAWLSEPQRGPDSGAEPPPSKEEMLRLLRRKRAAEAERLELANHITAGRYISRELVKTHIFGALEAANKRLLGDAPRTIARRAYALRDSGQPVEDAVRVVEDTISGILRELKEKALRALRSTPVVESASTTTRKRSRRRKGSA